MRMVSGAWNGYNSIKGIKYQWSLLTCDFFSQIEVNSIQQFNRVNIARAWCSFATISVEPANHSQRLLVDVELEALLDILRGHEAEKSKPKSELKEIRTSCQFESCECACSYRYTSKERGREATEQACTDREKWDEITKWEEKTCLQSRFFHNHLQLMCDILHRRTHRGVEQSCIRDFTTSVEIHQMKTRYEYRQKYPEGNMISNTWSSEIQGHERHFIQCWEALHWPLLSSHLLAMPIQAGPTCRFCRNFVLKTQTLEV